MNNLHALLNYRKIIMDEEKAFHYFHQLINIIKRYTIFNVEFNFTLQNIFFKDKTYNQLYVVEMNYFQIDKLSIYTLGKILEKMSSTFMITQKHQELIDGMISKKFSMKDIYENEWYKKFYYHYTSIYPIVPITSYRRFIMNGISEQSMIGSFLEKEYKVDYAGIFKDDLFEDIDVLSIYNYVTRNMLDINKLEKDQSLNEFQKKLVIKIKSI
jgi:hypothetical protein